MFASDRESNPGLERKARLLIGQVASVSIPAHNGKVDRLLSLQRRHFEALCLLVVCKM